MLVRLIPDGRNDVKEAGLGFFNILWHLLCHDGADKESGCVKITATFLK